MRGPSVALALLMLAGCVQPALETSSAVTPTLAMPEVPSGAALETLPDGLRLVWDAVELPFREEIEVPAGTTLVRLTGDAGESGDLSVNMVHAETGRRRCNVPNVDAWNVGVLGRTTCTGVAVIDELPDTWRFTIGGTADGGLFDPVIARVELEFVTTAPDGLLGALDLSQISRRTHTLLPTEIMKVPSFDGTPLHVEVTLPEGPGPWPTVLWSSPYNNDDRTAGLPAAAWTYFVRDWAERGYAVVSADVRGYGQSGGCVEVWSENEQLDQVFLVEWIAEQEWSDGNVGFYGQSYVATTPVEAAVYAPEALKAIVIVAPVNNAYDDWHHGGVPNGESLLSPAAYQVTTGVPTQAEPSDPLGTALNAVGGLCDPTLSARANDPRALYDAFYVERNFSARAGDIRAATLYTQGFEDTNVKSAMIPDFFNAITAPKLGLFGHWVHQHPTRADNEVLMVGWMDQYVKGKPVGFERLDAAAVVTNAGTHRTAASWPPLDAVPVVLHADLAGGALGAEPVDGEASILTAEGPTGPLPTVVSLEGEPLAAPLHFAGGATVRLAASLATAETAHVRAELYEVVDGKATLVTWGGFNLAHHQGHDTYAPLTPGEVVHVALPLLPTEWVFATGSSLRLELTGMSGLPPGKPDRVTFHGGEDGVALVLPTVDPATATPLPATAAR